MHKQFNDSTSWSNFPFLQQFEAPATVKMKKMSKRDPPLNFVNIPLLDFDNPHSFNRNFCKYDYHNFHHSNIYSQNLHIYRPPPSYHRNIQFKHNPTINNFYKPYLIYFPLINFIRFTLIILVTKIYSFSRTVFYHTFPEGWPLWYWHVFLLW